MAGRRLSVDLKAETLRLLTLRGNEGCQMMVAYTPRLSEFHDGWDPNLRVSYDYDPVRYQPGSVDPIPTGG